MRRLLRRSVHWALLAAPLLMTACQSDPDGHDISADMADYAYRNEPVPGGDNAFHPGDAGASIASSDIPWRIPAVCRAAYRAWLATRPGRVDRQAAFLATAACPQPPKQTFVGAAITGGGNKSAVYATEVLFELERYHLARHIDVVSSVSGGSFAASVYALSCDPDDTPCATADHRGWRPLVWDYVTVSKALETNYLWPFIRNRFSPDHLALNVTTHHGSSDDMADAVAKYLLHDDVRRLRFTDFNPARPNLILNATNTTIDRAAFDQDAGIAPDAKRPLSD